MTELPDSLVRFDRLLEGAVERDRLAARPGRRRRRISIRLAAVTGAVAIAATAVSLPGDEDTVGTPGVVTASAAERAAAVLSASPGSIVHHVATSRHVAADGSVSTWREETWRQTSRPYARREVTTRARGVRIETATVGERDAWLYDRAADTIYTNAPGGGPALGTPMPATDGDPLREQMVDLLRSRDARAVSRSTAGGREVIRFAYDNALPGGQVVAWTYVVDAETYQPIRLTSASPDGSRVTTRFRTYEALEATSESRALLSLRAQHPDAAVDRTEAGYEAAQRRVYAPSPSGPHEP